MIFLSKTGRRERYENILGKEYYFADYTCEVTDQAAIEWFLKSGFKPIENDNNEQIEITEDKPKRRRRTKSEIEGDK